MKTIASRQQLEESITLAKKVIPELLERWEKAPTSHNANALHQIREGLALTQAKLDRWTRRQCELAAENFPWSEGDPKNLPAVDQLLIERTIAAEVE